MDYIYYNNNMLGIEESDCVTRAISLASGYSYAAIQDKLYYISKLYDCSELDVCCYQHLLNDVFQYPQVYCYGMTVEEFAEENPIGVYILRMNGHASCLVNGVLHDIWNCEDLELTHVWQVE